MNVAHLKDCCCEIIVRLLLGRGPVYILHQKKDLLVRLLFLLRGKRKPVIFHHHHVAFSEEVEDFHNCLVAQGHLDERIKQQEQSVAALQDQT